MKTAFCLLAAALLVSATGASAQSFTATADQPLGAALPTAAPTPLAPTGTYTQRFASGGSLTYFGAVASHDACHEQFARLRQAFEASAPTVVYYEKPDCGTDSTEGATIGRLGEPGYARLLAQRHQVPAERLDNPDTEYAYLQTKVDAERLKLFYLLRQTQRMRALTGASTATTKQALQQLIANSNAFLPGTGGVIRNMAEFETAYQKHCPAAGKWWKAPATWFDSNAATASTSSAFIKEMGVAITEFREQHTYRQLAERAQAGERVLVVVDRDHLPTQAAALASK